MPAFIYEFEPVQTIQPARFFRWVEPGGMSGFSLTGRPYLGKFIIVSCLANNTSTEIYERDVGYEAVVDENAADDMDEFMIKSETEPPDGEVKDGSDLYIAKIGDLSIGMGGLLIGHSTEKILPKEPPMIVPVSFIVAGHKLNLN